MRLFRVVALAGAGFFQILISAPASSASAAVSVSTTEVGKSSYVNPLIGTAQSVSFRPGMSQHGGGGNTDPGAVLPFGMIQFGANTVHPGRFSYIYEDKKIEGFSLLHLSGAGCIISHELPSFPMFMPLVQADLSSLAEAPPLAVDAVEFSHDDETAAAGYYHVKLKNQIQVDLSATMRTGFAMFEYPASTPAHALALRLRVPTQKNAFHRIGDSGLGGEVDAGGFCDAGNHFKIYYAMAFDQPVQLGETRADLATLLFKNSDSKKIKVRIGLSYVSEKNAQENLQTENPKWDFDAVKAQAAAQWDKVLGRVDITGGTKDQKTVFYTALYHSLLHPNVFNDTNGEYIGFDNKVHNASAESRPRTQYANYSDWDTYRTQIQLLAILFPDRASDMIASLIEDGTECGAMPRWAYNNAETGVMIGDPASLLVAGAYAFGAKNFDLNRALSLMKRSGTDPIAGCMGHPARPGLAEYLKYGYVPFGTPQVWGEVATTLEYEMADHAVANLMASAGDEKTAEVFRARSKRWPELFDPGTKLFRPKDQNGKWLTPFSDSSEQGFAEGNAIQYSWSLPFDLDQLLKRMGPPAKTMARLNEFFTKLNVGERDPHFWVGNEPGFATPWVYSKLGHPEKTSRLLERVLSTEFSNVAGGLPGNDDLGAMSAWYVWAALGLYPMVPGEATFEITPPVFVSAATLQLGNGHAIHWSVVKKKSHSKGTDLELNGSNYAKSSVPWATLENGADLKFRL